MLLAMAPSTVCSAHCTLSLLVLLAAPVGLAEPGERDSVPQEVPAVLPEAGPSVDLDLLLRLPDSYVANGRRRGGASAGEWRSRFFEAREALGEQQATLERLHKKMEGMAGGGGSWAAGAPGLSNPDPQHSTLNYKLRQDLRRARESVEQAERDLRALRVEADIASVPESWRE